MRLAMSPPPPAAPPIVPASPGPQSVLALQQPIKQHRRQGRFSARGVDFAVSRYLGLPNPANAPASQILTLAHGQGDGAVVSGVAPPRTTRGHFERGPRLAT